MAVRACGVRRRYRWARSSLRLRRRRCGQPLEDRGGRLAYSRPPTRNGASTNLRTTDLIGQGRLWGRTGTRQSKGWSRKDVRPENRSNFCQDYSRLWTARAPGRGRTLAHRTWGLTSPPGGVILRHDRDCRIAWSEVPVVRVRLPPGRGEVAACGCRAGEDVAVKWKADRKSLHAG